tara:strand:+ start:37 stop:963 length:927 start_codon:yes stop_codon:yes gene_type:complete
MCNPAAAFGFQAAGAVGNYFSQRAAAQARNRARLLNFRQENIAYYNDAMLKDVNWKNQQQDTQIAYDTIFQRAAESWRQADLAREEAYSRHANFTVKALKELYRKEYAGTQTGVTASRLANEPIRQVGMAIANSQRQYMMAKDKTLLQKEIIRNDANVRRRAAFRKTWRSPVHGWTPEAPQLEAGPGLGSLALQLGIAAVGSFGFGEGGWFTQGGGGSTSLAANNIPLSETFGMQGLGISDPGLYSSLSNVSWSTPTTAFSGGWAGSLPTAATSAWSTTPWITPSTSLTSAAYPNFNSSSYLDNFNWY